MKRVYKDAEASAHWSAAKHEERSWSRGETADQTRVKSGFCSSIGSCFGKKFKTCVLDALAGRRDSCLLGEPIRRRPVLLGSTPPRCPAVRPDPTRPWYVRALDSTGYATLENV